MRGGIFLITRRYGIDMLRVLIVYTEIISLGNSKSFVGLVVTSALNE